MFWPCAEEGGRVCQEKSVDDEAIEQEKKKTKEEVHGCGDGGYVGGWFRALVDKKTRKKHQTFGV